MDIKEVIARLEAYMPRKDIAKKINVTYVSLSRWSQGANISNRNKGKLERLYNEVRVRKIDLSSLDSSQLVSELKKRGWKVTIESID